MQLFDPTRPRAESSGRPLVLGTEGKFPGGGAIVPTVTVDVQPDGTAVLTVYLPTGAGTFSTRQYSVAVEPSAAQQFTLAEFFSMYVEDPEQVLSSCFDWRASEHTVETRTGTRRTSTSVPSAVSYDELKLDP